MSNVQTVLRKRNITPEQVGKMVLGDFLTARRNYMADPTSRGGVLETAEKEMLMTRAGMSPNRRDLTVYLVLRDILHELTFRQVIAKQGFDLAYSKLSHMVEMATAAEMENSMRIGRKGRTSPALFESWRAENLLNQRNVIESLKASMVRSMGFLKASNVALACVSRVVRMESIQAESVPLEPFFYDVGELQSMIDDLLTAIKRDGREPDAILFPGGLPVSTVEWLEAIELATTAQRIEVDHLKKELGDMLTISIDFNKTAVSLFERNYSFGKLLTDGVRYIEKLTSNLLKN